MFLVMTILIVMATIIAILCIIVAIKNRDKKRLEERKAFLNAKMRLASDGSDDEEEVEETHQTLRQFAKRLSDGSDSGLADLDPNSLIGKKNKPAAVQEESKSG